MKISSLLVLLQSYLDSRSFEWYVRPLHMHRKIIVSHSLVTEIKKRLTQTKIGTQIAFQWHLTSKWGICVCIAPVTKEPLSFLHLNRHSVCWFTGEVICRSNILQVQRALHSHQAMNQSTRQAEDMVCLHLMVASQNLALYDYILVEKSLAAFSTFLGQ